MLQETYLYYRLSPNPYQPSQQQPKEVYRSKLENIAESVFASQMILLFFQKNTYHILSFRKL
jgi:hypothetical protein